MSNSIRDYWFLFISIGLHIVFLVGINFNKFTKIVMPGEAVHKIIVTYTQTDSLVQATEVLEKKDVSVKEEVVKKINLQKNKKPSAPTFTPKKIVEPTKEAKPRFAKKMTPINKSKGKAADQLLLLLHQAIQNEQHYPFSAIEMGREGRVKIGFTLFKTGEITNVHMISSSGVSVLDGEALKAVHHAAPFKQVEKYLQSTQEFSVDVVFKLS